MTGSQRATQDDLLEMLRAVRPAPPAPRVTSIGPTPTEWVRENLERGHHGGLHPAEGVVWRVERRGKVDFLAKWVRPNKVDGRYLPEISARAPVRNIPP